jgi:hypothetical protein
MTCVCLQQAAITVSDKTVEEALRAVLDSHGLPLQAMGSTAFGR